MTDSMAGVLEVLVGVDDLLELEFLARLFYHPSNPVHATHGYLKRLWEGCGMVKGRWKCWKRLWKGGGRRKRCWEGGGVIVWMECWEGGGMIGNKDGMMKDGER